MKIELPPQVKKILDRLSAKGHEAYIVGGCVRDSLMGRVPQDWDVTTSALPEETKLALTGIPVLETGIRHGTVGAVLNGMVIEITTYRIDGNYSDNRHPDHVTFTRSLREDLARRDFTINALAYSEKDGVIDYFGGRVDLANRTLRCVGEAQKRFKEDALRILRGMRFASVLGFSPETETARCMKEQRALLEHIAKERVCHEISRLLCGTNAEQVLREFSTVMFQIFPELSPMFGFEQHSPYHRFNVWEHTLLSIGAVPPELELRLSMLFHDAGKPECFTLDEAGVGHFYGHPAVSEAMAGQALNRLKFDLQTTRQVQTLIHFHGLPLVLEEKWVRRQLNRMGENTFRQLLLVLEADCRACGTDPDPRLEQLTKIKALLEQVIAKGQCFSLKDLAVNGRDLLNLGLSGKALGQTLQLLLKYVIDGDCPNQKEQLLKLARERNPNG